MSVIFPLVFHRYQAPAIGSLKGEDASPIKNKDILYFFAENPDTLISGYSIALKPTPEVKKYLASKVQSDGGASGTIYNIILNINGKEYPNCGGGVLDGGGFAALFFCPYITDLLHPTFRGAAA